MPGGSEAVDEKFRTRQSPELSPADVVEHCVAPKLQLLGRRAFDIEQKTAWNVIARRSYKDAA